MKDFLPLIIGILLLICGYGLGFFKGVEFGAKEAVAHHYAQWVADNTGTERFKWNDEVNP